MARIKPQALLIQSKKKKGPSRISATTIVLCTSIVALIILLFSTYRHWSRRSTGDQTGTSQSVFEDANAFIDSKKYVIPGYAILNTSKGHIVVELFKDGSPQIVDKFIDLCQKGYFKGMPFNHVIKNFVIHGAYSEGLGAAEDWTSKGKLHDWLATSPKHEAFMLGTSKTRDRKVFELYITTAPIPDLNDKLLVFGRVIKGGDVVQVKLHISRVFC
ncbi:peptidyl-prolyl cis-trans isomerase CYP21-4-like isoform X2 [Tripterygium wilfordii]|uniref:peptidyl-prolyl cis-trans isomerase CYP21-4-like isoform X2 n=1 Tax=Tripterygium wilfordii TaxID=458696 RepID=UPI0018F8318F|nr:peptidyl-prolyl cis-trans isomerase CYP21-4-like isoform X2 [Tripterygium wilfordii]